MNINDMTVAVVLALSGFGFLLLFVKMMRESDFTVALASLGMSIAMLSSAGMFYTMYTASTMSDGLLAFELSMENSWLKNQYLLFTVLADVGIFTVIGAGVSHFIGEYKRIKAIKNREKDAAKRPTREEVAGQLQQISNDLRQHALKRRG